MGAHSPVRASLATALLAAVGTLYAQQAESKDGEFSVAGYVVNSATGEPLARALVQLNCWAMQVAGEHLPLPQPPYNGSTLTDSGGVFRFSGLSGGNCNVSANKPGFAADNDTRSQSQVFAIGPSREDLTLRLSPLGVIEGTVVDQAHEAVPSVTVQALRIRIELGRRKIQVDRDVRTDDRGRYRLWSLEPGKYLLKAAGRNSGTSQFLGSRAPSETHEAFAPVYFGGADTAASAAPVIIGPGQQVRADFSLTLAPAYTVRGTLAGFVPYRKVTFELLRNGDEAAKDRIYVNSTSGAFELHDLAPGSYRVRAIQGEKEQRTAAQREVQVTNSDIIGLEMRLIPGTTVRGVVRGSELFEDHPVPTGPHGPISQFRGSVALHATNDRDNGDLTAMIGPDGAFELKNVLAGEYQIEIIYYPGYVESVTSGAQDLLSTNRLIVPEAGSVAPLEIQTRADSGGLEIAVQTEKLPENAGLLLVPEFAPSTGPQSWGAGGTTFQVGKLRPGDYVAYLVPNWNEIEYTNPDVLRTLRGGVKVHIEASQEAKVALTELAQ